VTDTAAGSTATRGALSRRVGGKASGLLELPAEWTLPFVVLEAAIVRDIAQATEEDSAALVDALLCVEIAALVETSSRLIVRSSAVYEGIDARGSFDSEVCDASMESARDAIVRLISANDAREGQRNFGVLGLVIQQYVEPRLRGHASNERRVSRRHDSWLIETTGAGDELIGHYNVADRPSRLVDRKPGAFVCRAEADLRDTIRSVTASTSLLPPGRRHLEWIWDGERVWIVQNDLEVTPPGGEPGSEWTRPVVAPPGEMAVLVPASAAAGQWQKARCVKVFSELGLSTSDLWVLEDEPTIAAIAEPGGEPTPALQRDLEQVCVAPVVVRTDRTGHTTGGDEVLMPRTETCLSVGQVVDFIRTTSCAFVSSGLEVGQFCFLIHRFIPARTGTYSIARPGVAKVRVDSTWGMPDGLLYLPHDSFEVDLRDLDTTWSKLRCKYAYVDIRNDGTWFERRAGSPWDWEQSIDRDDLQTVARQAALIAEYVGKPVEVMHFVGVSDITGLPQCLPWFFRETDASARRVERAPHFARNRVTIRTPDDLVALEAVLRHSTGAATSIGLSAACEFLRERELVHQVAALANTFGLPVDLEGSALAHVFYMLRALGVRVRAYEYADPPPPATRTFDKLVRDDVPRMIEDGGERAVAVHATGDALRDLLARKVVEESLELFAASTRTEVIGEAADVLEVVKAICHVWGIDEVEVQESAALKRQTRGGFSEGVVLKSTFVPSALPQRAEGVLFESDAPSQDGAPQGRTRSRTTAGRGSPILRVSRVPGVAGSPSATLSLPAPMGAGTLVIRNDGEYVEIEWTPAQTSEVDGQLSLFGDNATPAQAHGGLS
jgi:predicted house-cleaning noncanonical NTP pyrophosphatase (MazG superfamily)